MGIDPVPVIRDSETGTFGNRESAVLRDGLDLVAVAVCVNRREQVITHLGVSQNEFVEIRIRDRREAMAMRGAASMEFDVDTECFG